MAIVNGSFKGVIKLTSYFRRSAYASTALLSLLVLAILCPIYLVPDVSEAATHDSTPATLTYTSIRNTASVSFNVSSTAGTFATSDSNETASFSLSTNNATGYTLNLRTSGSETTLAQGANSISAINGSKLSSEFAVNTWGLLPSKYNSTANTTNYYPASNAGFTIEETNTANSSNGIDNPNTYTIGLGIKADFTVPAGTYTNSTIIAEYVANNITYAIYYYSNTEDTVTDMPANNPQSPQSPVPGTTSTTANLASAPSRTGYTFLGWCMGTSSSSNITVGTNGAADTCASSSTNQFTAGQSFGINATNSATDTYYMYAMWQANTYTVTISNTNTTSSVASLTVPYGGSSTVTVTPASGYYLSSVSCPSGYTCTGYTTTTSSTGAQTVTVTNNNTANGGTLSFTGSLPPLYMWNASFADCGTTMYDNRDGTERQYTTAEINGLCWMTQNLMLGASSSVTLYKATTNITADTYTLPARGTYGASYSGQYVWGNDTQCTTSSTTACAGYYSYATATAGTNPSSDATSSDICPANWRLPTQVELTTLKNSYSTGPAFKESPFLGVYTGFYSGSNFYNGGAGGSYWSSTAYSNDSGYGLNFYSSGARVDGYDKYFGFAVRCVMKPTMQDATVSSLAAAMPNTGDTTTLVDARDGQEYSIAKLADNKYWMTKNLNLAGGTALDADKTDVDSSFISSFTTSNNLTKTGSTIVLPASSTSGFNTGNYAYVYNSGSTTCGNNSPCYSYYSWDAATLGSGRSIATDNTNAPYSICPKGWHLPTTYNGSGTSAEATDFRALMIALGGSNSVQTYYSSTTPTGATMSTTLQSSPNSFLPAGYYYDSSFLDGGSYGLYLSATSYSNSNYARYLSFYSTYVYSANYGYRSAGFSVRCVKDSDGYMQDFALANATDGLEYTLKDKRDDKTYTVKKINDALWMTQNLRYLGDTGSSAGTMTIGNNNSNVANTSITLYSLDSSNAGNFGAYANHCDATNSYNYACVYDSSSTTTGVWYNYNAATAGTISTDNNSTTASNSICPAGWRLPSFDTGKPAGSINSISLASQIAPFNPSGGGRYNNGSLNYTDYGFWWTDTARNATERRLMSYDGSSPAIESYDRRYGLFVRCVRST